MSCSYCFKTIQHKLQKKVLSDIFKYAFATRALEAGMDVKVLSSILGHAQASTTLNLYAHALPDHKRDSMEKMRSFYRSDFDTNGGCELDDGFEDIAV